MIAKLTGLLDDTGPDWAIIDVNGVGYLVHCSARTLDHLGIRGDRVVVHTEMQVSETDQRLIGFASAAERNWFRLLTAVQGVGSKVALAILSALTTEELQRACAGGDSAMVARANGVGPKLASRIVNELKDKAGGLPVAPGTPGIAATAPAGSASADAVSALQQPGLQARRCGNRRRQAGDVLGEDAPLGDLMRVALKRASG